MWWWWPGGESWWWSGRLRWSGRCRSGWWRSGRWWSGCWVKIKLILKVVLEAEVSPKLREGDRSKVRPHRVAEVLHGGETGALAGRGVWRLTGRGELHHGGSRLKGQGLENLLGRWDLCGHGDGVTGGAVGTL